MLVNIYDTTTTWTSVKITKMLSQIFLDEERLTSIWNETMIPIFDPRRKVFIEREYDFSQHFTEQRQPSSNWSQWSHQAYITIRHQVYLIRSPILEEFLVLLSSDPWSALRYK